MGGPRRHDRDLILNEYSSFEDVERKYKALLEDRQFLENIKYNKKIKLKKSVYLSWKTDKICSGRNQRDIFIASGDCMWYRYPLIDFDTGRSMHIWYFEPQFKTIRQFNAACSLNLTDKDIKKFK